MSRDAWATGDPGQTHDWQPLLANQLRERRASTPITDVRSVRVGVAREQTPSSRVLGCRNTRDAEDTGCVCLCLSLSVSVSPTHCPSVSGPQRPVCVDVCPVTGRRSPGWFQVQPLQRTEVLVLLVLRSVSGRWPVFSHCYRDMHESSSHVSVCLYTTHRDIV